MSDFTDQLATDATNVFCNASEFGESVTYTARGAGSGSSVTAVPVDLPDTDDSTRRRWWVRNADVSTPARGDQITDGSGAVWTVDETFSSAAGGTFAMHALDTRLTMDAD